MTCRYCEKDAVYKCAVCGKPICMEHVKLRTLCTLCTRKQRLEYAIGKAVSEEEREEIRKLVRRFWGELEQLVFDRKLMVADLPAYVAKAENDVVGFASYAEAWNALIIVALGVLPEYQTSDVGKELIKKVESEAMHMHKKRLLVSISNDDLPALAFYQRLGFQIYEVKPNVIAEKHGAVLQGIGGLPIRDELRLRKTPGKYESRLEEAPGVGLEPTLEPAPVSVRVYGFLVSRGSACLRDVYEGLGERPSLVDDCLRRLWKRGLILRTREPSFVFELESKGRGGVVGYTRAINYYVVNDGREIPSIYVRYDDRRKDGRSREIESKASRILDFLLKNRDKAFYSVDIMKELSLKSGDVMTNAVRFERKGLVYVRGYQTHDQRSPFKKGYILTYIDQQLPRDRAIREAFERTSKIVTENPSSNTILERVRLIRDQLLTANELLSLSYFKHVLGCSIDKVKIALKRAKQLYPDIKETRIFDKFTYYYLDSMKPEDLAANIELKKNYIRVRFGKENRIGHNWEACAEWFIDRFTEGAEFVSQNHRQKMDPRRITLHLLKQVGDRKQSAEVDRIWKVTPGLFSPTVTYVLECKWSVVNKKALDEFLEVLKWSTDFGVDNENGRELKKGVVPVFAGGIYKAKEMVVVNAERILLSQYASRMNIKLLRPADFNEKLREHSVDKRVTVQKVCRICKDEKQVREVLDQLWNQSMKAEEVLVETLNQNNNVFEFEKTIN